MGSKHRWARGSARSSPSCRPGRRWTRSPAAAWSRTCSRRPGARCVANDPLAFAATVTEALVANDEERLAEQDVATICSGNRDGREFIQRTFDGLYFPRSDHAFLDAAHSQIETLRQPKRALAIGALCLAAAWKQPRGVFTITTPRYDDGRASSACPRSALPRGGAGVQCGGVPRHARVREPPGRRARRSPVTTRSPTSTRRTRPRATTPTTSSATTSSRAWPRTGRTRRSCGRPARESSSSATPRSPRSAPQARSRTLFEHFKESTLVVSYGSNAAMDVERARIAAAPPQGQRPHARDPAPVRVRHPRECDPPSEPGVRPDRGLTMTALSDNVVKHSPGAEERGMHRGWIPVAATALALMPPHRQGQPISRPRSRRATRRRRTRTRARPHPACPAPSPRCPAA